MRDLKFRYFAFFDKTWHYYDLINDNGVLPDQLGIYGGLSRPQQYTGLKDVRGNEIYEGDIFNTKAARWKVVFESGAFWAQVIWSQVLPMDYVECLFIMTNDVILLGNDLANPELLKI